MNGTGTLDQRVEAYVESVGRALGELDPEDRTAILDDVREHAAAVLAEDPQVELEARLGTPQDFARDLLEAAGLVMIPPSRVDLRVRLARLQATRLGQALGRAGRDFAPAIAVLRGVAAMWLLTQLVGGPTRHLAILLVLGGLAGWLLSAQYETLISRNGTPGRVLSVVANVATAIVALVMAAAWASGLSEPAGDVADTWADPVENGYLNAGAILAFGPDGTPVPVALYDQDGNPLLTDAASYLSCSDHTLVPVAVPYLSSSGQPMDNVAPARGVCVDADYVVVAEASVGWSEPLVQAWSTAGMPQVGQTVVVDEFGAFTGMALEPAPSPSPTPSDAPSPSPSPSDAPSPPSPADAPLPTPAPPAG